MSCFTPYDSVSQALPQNLTPNNIVVINSESDFPIPSGGVITLEDNKTYYIGAPISTANRFVMGVSNALTANNPLTPILEYTGTGTMFTGVDNNFTAENILLNAPNGQVFDMSSTGAGGNFLLLTLVIVLSCDKYGTFDNLQTIDITNSSSLATNDGLTIIGTTNWAVFSVTKFAMITTSATFVGIDLGVSVHKTMELTNYVVRGVTGAIALKGAAASANMTLGFLGMMQLSEFEGDVTPLSGLTTKDIRWSFTSNSSLPDTKPAALINFKGNATTTTIAASSTDGSNSVLIDSTWTEEDSSHFTFLSAGRLTYAGEIDRLFSITLISTLNPVNNNTIALYIALNGTAIDGTGLGQIVNKDDAQSLVTTWELTLSENDYVEAFIENQTGTVDIDAINGILKID